MLMGPKGAWAKSTSFPGSFPSGKRPWERGWGVGVGVGVFVTERKKRQSRNFNSEIPRKYSQSPENLQFQIRKCSETFAWRIYIQTLRMRFY